MCVILCIQIVKPLAKQSRVYIMELNLQQFENEVCQVKLLYRLSIYIIVGVRVCVCVSGNASLKGQSKLCEAQPRERGAFGAANA